MAGVPEPATSDRTVSARLLLVDDNPMNLRVLFQTLKARGHELFVATSGEDALAVAGEVHPNLILLDIMMPGIDGFETCRRLKSDPSTRDSAVIFMSALNETQDKVRGLDLGAVDYITKPFHDEEVLARVDTHLTIQRLQRDLAQRNAELQDANERMTRDLRAAARVQRALLPRAMPTSERTRFEWTYRPCDELGGDSLGIFSFDDRHVGMYVLDVAGHGVPAALLSVAVTHSLSPRDPGHSLVTRSQWDAGEDWIIAPAEVASHLNRLFPCIESDFMFFTLVYVVLDTHSGRLRYVAAGHPGPLILRADGTTEAHDSTGVPIGVVEEATFEERVLEVGAGDRVYLYSDGAVEERKNGLGLFGSERLQTVLAGGRTTPLAETLDSVIDAIGAWAGATAFRDDISLVAAEIVES